MSENGNGENKFDWPRMYKIEEHLEREAFDSAAEYVCEFYDIEEIYDLTQEQISEIENFKDTINEFSPMRGAFFDVINVWESNQEYAEEDYSDTDYSK